MRMMDDQIIAVGRDEWKEDNDGMAGIRNTGRWEKEKGMEYWLLPENYL